jgi:hypothetical protein
MDDPRSPVELSRLVEQINRLSLFLCALRNHVDEYARVRFLSAWSGEPPTLVFRAFVENGGPTAESQAEGATPEQAAASLLERLRTSVQAIRSKFSDLP